MHARGRGACQGARMVGDICGRGCEWQGACMPGGGVHARGHACRRSVCAGEKATEAGGTHPTGMHSC